MEKRELISKSAQQIADYHQLYKSDLRSLVSLQETDAAIRALRNSANSIRPALNALKLDTLSPMIRSINEVNMVIKNQQQWQKSLRSIDALIREVLEVQQQFHRVTKNLGTDFNKIFAMLPDSLATQRKLFELRRYHLGAAINASASLKKSLHLNLDNFVKSYKRLFDASAIRPPIIANFEPIIAQYPTLEIFRETEVLEAITVPEYEKEFPAEYEAPRVPEEKDLEVLLQEVDMGLPNLLQGARKALNSDNHDRARHITVSLRELIGHVILLLAPDDSIHSWTDDPHYYHKGRPTRRARLLYINRKINSDSLSKFVDTDVASTLALIDALNAGAHVVSSSLTDRQLRALIDRAEALLLFLLRLNNQQ